MANPLTYSQSIDFPGATCNAGNLADELLASANVVTALRPGPVVVDGDVVEVWFNAEPTAGDVVEVDAIVAAHDSTPKPRQPITADGTPVVHADQPVDPKTDLPLVQSFPYRPGVQLCDRDVKIKTCVVDESDAVEDLRYDTQDGRKRKDWGEVILVGVFKGDDASGYSACSDQADANANGTLSVFRYYARDQSDPSGVAIDCDVTGGAIWVDEDLDDEVLGLMDETKAWAHQVYAVGLPDVPPPYGSVKMFDGYLYPYKGKWMNSTNPIAMTLDPLAGGEPANPALSTIEVGIFHPVGSKNRHVLRFTTYRNPSTH